MRHSQFIGGVLLVWGFTCLAGCQSAQSPKGATDDVEDIILAAIQDFFQALEARDAVRLSLVLREDAVLTRIDTRGDTLAVTRVSSADWVASVSQPGAPLIERFSDPAVHVSGGFADVWAYYDFHIGEELSHCGYDAIQMVEEEGNWRIVGLTYTLEPCR